MISLADALPDELPGWVERLGLPILILFFILWLIFRVGGWVGPIIKGAIDRYIQAQEDFTQKTVEIQSQNKEILVEMRGIIKELSSEVKRLLDDKS